jgi:hypothetical protein
MPTTRSLAFPFAVALALGATLTVGCTRTYTVRRPASVGELQSSMMGHGGGVVTPLLQETAPSEHPPAAPGPLVPWGTSLTPVGQVPLVQLSAIRGYEVKRRFAGGVEGLLLGAGVGVLTGAAIGSALGSDRACMGDGCIGFELSATDKAAIGAVFAGITGAVFGAFIGAYRGHTDRYLF